VNETLTLAPATPYDSWAQQITISALRSPFADADGDGYANLLEYVTGGNPSVRDNQSQLRAAVTNGLLSLTFTRNTNSSDATIYVEAASALTTAAPWASLATNQNGVWTATVPIQETGSGNPRTVTIQDAAASVARFYRLRITRP
jgi:hypothetical protein